MNQELTNELNRLAALNDGKLTPSGVVEAARNEASVLHDQFEWDDTKAGERYREAQARSLITRVILVRRSGPETTIRSVAYVRNPDCKPNEQGYIAVAKIASDEDRQREVLVDEARRIRAAIARARQLEAMFDLKGPLDELEGMVNRLPEATFTGPQLRT